MSLGTKDATRIPVSTYRLQLTKDFKFKQAHGITPYLKKLGISDCYSSPILKARRGSTHGYDVIDHQEINRELGSLSEFNQWISRLHSYDMGFLLDIVPNHMAISDENRLFLDVLEYGPFSKYSDFFDIDWNPSYPLDLKNRLILPILGTTVEEALTNHSISFTFSNGEFGLQVYSMKLPLTPQSYARILRYIKRKLQSAHFVRVNALRKLDRIADGFEKLPNSLSSGIKESIYPFRFASKKKGDLTRLCLTHPDMSRAMHQALNEFQNSVRDDGYDEIKNLLREQFFKLEFWKNAINIVNYRRFATVNDLIAIREERPTVFEEAHEFIFNLITSRKIDGLRVDHVDGLYDPADYLSRLQKNCRRNFRISNNNTSVADHRKTFYVIVEKILGEGENVPRNWSTNGTTGYEFLCDLNSIFVDSFNSSKFDRIYSNFVSGQNTNFERIVESCRRKIVDSSMQSELMRLTNLFFWIGKDLHDSNYASKEDVKEAIREVAISFPVYRTYSSSQVSARDSRYVEESINSARVHFSRKGKTTNKYNRILNEIRAVLLFDYPRNISQDQRDKWRSFVMRFQQFTAPIAAKGIEDTAFYVYNRLTSLNEVGGNPRKFGISIEEFHKRNLDRLATHPHTLLTTSTHDTKRSEDVRARINVLSEIPDQWNEALLSWSNLNRSKKRIVGEEEEWPSKNDEYLLYQTMLGVWPLRKVNKEEEREELIQRISSYMKKAVKEAKLKTSWTDPNLEYERALDEFIKSILDSPRSTKTSGSREFISSFEKFQKQVSYYGMLNSLSQLLIKLTSPGIPDIYQGNEIWDFSLVDPDNRRPVDFELRSKMLSSLERRIKSAKSALEILARNLVSNMDSGLIKMYVLHQGLKFRNEHEKLFKNGTYVPLVAKGPKSEHVFAFMRKTQDDECIVVATRLFVSLLNSKKYHNAKNIWKDTSVVLPKGKRDHSYSDIFTGRKIEVARDQEANAILHLSSVLDEFPIALIWVSLEKSRKN
jgi:(1->4)-alpha-D-glucan 1-alpha-D-glucosylmutase